MNMKTLAKKLTLSFVVTIFVASCIRTEVYANTKSTEDAVYDSMTMPSESRSDYMISANRDYGQIIGDTSSSKIKKVVSIGALYPTNGKAIPKNFSVYLGNIKLFAYSLKRARWIVLDSQPYPKGIYTYTLPWTSSKASECKNVTYTDGYAKVDLTSDDLNNSCLHFWGNSVLIDKSDYLFYACAYSFWVDPSAADTLTATNGIDAKGTSSTTIVQLYSSRGMSAQSYPKIHWGHTVPETEYNNYNTTSLNQLYINGQIEPRLDSENNSESSGLIDPKQPRTNITKFKSYHRAIAIKWHRQTAKADGYQVQYSTDKKFKKKSKLKIIKKPSTKSLLLNKLKSNKKYYFRIRTYRKVGKYKVYSKWSKRISITTK